MNRQLYQLCIDYIRCYDLLQALISIDGIDGVKFNVYSGTGFVGYEEVYIN